VLATAHIEGRLLDQRRFRIVFMPRSLSYHPVYHPPNAKYTVDICFVLLFNGLCEIGSSNDAKFVDSKLVSDLC
jgi:hypothetical protein